MNTAHIAVVSLGGTITMTSAAADGAGVKPSLTAADLLASVPGLEHAAQVTAHTPFTMPGASLTFAELNEALELARKSVDDGHSGVVVVQGTDTIEETAYLFDLYWDREEPLIVTGAMRAAQVAGADGPANLLASVHTAASPASRGRGVLVVMNDEIHAASRVRKVRSSGTNALATPSFGPLGYIEESIPVFGGEIDRAGALAAPVPESPARVALLETYLGDSGELLDLVVEGGYDGAVVSAFGVGHVSAALAETISRALERIPVVFATRTGSGTTYTQAYGFVGSESDLLARGAIGAGWLDPRKARILLSCVLSESNDRARLSAEFERRGRVTA
ncbi:asparaginase [Glaciibacter superstes]|uniref:asparaginase n=1 Tax=Glaciibacter superstes TaxID=501023 RepID=UPI0003B309A9|nr:asparaginase [Glaciibacter superstes]